MKYKFLINTISALVGIGTFLWSISLENIQLDTAIATAPSDPFTKESQKFITLLDQNITEKTQLFSPEGEFFSLDDQGYLDTKTRELFGGNLFWSTSLLYQKNSNIPDPLQTAGSALCSPPGCWRSR